MTSSTNPGTGRRAGAGAALALGLAGLLLTGCQAGPAPAEPPASPRTDVTATPGTTARDGRTIEAAGSDACNTPGLEKIKDQLGAAAAHLQPAVPAATLAQGVVLETSCTFSLAPVPAGQEPDPGNALTITTTVYADEASLAAARPPRLMMSPEPVEGLGARAWYSRNTLSETTEYVLETVNGVILTRANLALPNTAPPVDKAKDKLATLLTRQ